MADYTRQRATALKLIKRYGTLCVLTTYRNDGKSAQGWKVDRSEAKVTELPCVVFDDDGETFINHNISGRTRIILLAPDVRVTNVDVGDKVTINAGTPREETLNVEKIKQLNPAAEQGAILWTLLLR